jgi:hypothetical protein
MAKKIGLYLGLNSVGAVACEKGKIISSASFDLASFDEEAKVDNVNEDVRWEALINKTLREIRGEDKNICLSLADKDFIFRSLEMPLMDKKSVGSSLVYEIERYIPFKIDELWWDYSSIRYPKEKKLNVSFIGIRENAIFRARELLSHLGFNAVILEPSSLSLVKVVKSVKKFAAMKNFAILDVTEFEAYLTFFYQDLPVFNQYIVVPKAEEGFNFEKFVEAVRFAFQYFKREFKYYDLEKLIMISSLKEEKLQPLLKEELQTDTELFSPLDVATNPNVSIEALKAFGTAISQESSYKFKPELKKTEIVSEEKEAVVTEAPSLRLGLLAALICLGAIACIMFSVFLKNNENLSRYEIQKIERAIVRPAPLKGLSWKEVDNAVKQQQNKLKILKDLSVIKNLAPSLVNISAQRPKGLWFDSLDVSSKKDKYRISLEGNAFLGDIYLDRAAIDEFVLNLKNDGAIKANFSNVEMTKSEKKTVGEYNFTHFSIRME